MDLLKPFRILGQRLTHQGLATTFWWAADHAVRTLLGRPILRVSQITPQLHVGGQHRRHGLRAMAARGITAVVNLRGEFDDATAGLAPERYLYLPTVDDHPPSLEQLDRAVAFISEEIEAGGAVYIHCGAGVGRAATVAAAYLLSTGLTPQEAWDRIRLVRPFIRPTPPQIEQIERFAARH